MAGLLDMNDDGVRLGLGLLAAASARSDGAGFGQRLAEAVGSVDQWRQQQQMAKMQELQMQQHRLALQQAQQQAAKQQQFEELVSKYRTPAQPGLSPLLGDSILPPHMQSGIMPTAGVPAKPAGFDREGFAAAYEGVDPIKGFAYQQSIQKDNSPLAVKKDEVLLDRKTMKPVFSNVQPEKDPTAIQEYKFAQSQGYGGTFQQFVLEQKRAGATSIVNNMDKGFGEAFAKDAASNLSASRDAAKAAANNITTLNRVDEIVSTGKVAVGPTAKFEQFGRQLGNSLGIGGKDNAEVLANTRKLMQSSAQLAADGASMLAKQGQITDGERALISKAAGGDIDSMTMPEIQALSGALKKVNYARIASHQSMLQNVDKKFSAFVPFYQVQAPEVTQANQTPATPNVVQWEALK